MPATTVSETSYEDSDGREVTQYRTTVPKGLAEALGLGGTKVEWEVKSENSVLITKVDD